MPADREAAFAKRVRRGIVKGYFAVSGLTEAEYHLRLDNLTHGRHNLDAIDCAKAMRDEFRAGRVPSWWLGLCSPGERGVNPAGNGTGKTTIASALLADAMRALHRGMITLELVLLEELLNADFGAKRTLIKRYIDVELLVLDDFGKRKQGQGGLKGYDLECLFEILDTRMRRNLPVVLTTNLTLADIGGMYGMDFLSRLRGKCKRVVNGSEVATWHTLTGPDRRTNKGVDEQWQR